MSLLYTIIGSALLMLLVVAALCIGWMVTGKMRLRRGCGMLPKKGDKKQKNCSICGSNKVCDEDEEKKT